MLLVLWRIADQGESVVSPRVLTPASDLLAGSQRCRTVTVGSPGVIARFTHGPDTIASVHCRLSRVIAVRSDWSIQDSYRGSCFRLAALGPAN